MVWRELGRMRSVMPMSPASLPVGRDQHRGRSGRASRASCAPDGRRRCQRPLSSAALPISTAVPVDATPCTPCPGTLRRPDRLPVGRRSRAAAAAATMAWESGCVECARRRRPRRAGAPRPSSRRRDEVGDAGLPSVSVPVLSRMMVWIRADSSSVVASLIRMLCLAPMPVPTATAVGVASPSASGQAMTTAEMAKVSA